MFRILDLGAHDGFVTLWLGRQLREHGIDFHIDGLELHPGAVGIANARAAAEGFSAQYCVGLAEDAPDKFGGGYDAVIAFEVIEHVPDVDYFLDQIEACCKEDGRVYLSTPDGCFGAGNNPHHLRVYRSLDLFELCRRRGTVQDLHPGRDGVVVISYTPDHHRAEASIYCGPGWETWHPRDIETKGMGGSETAAAQVAKHLSEVGYVVTLYGEVEEGMWGQVVLRHHTVYDPMQKSDLTIVSRQPALLDRKINADTVLFWMHDTDYGPMMTKERFEQVDKVLVLSDWHRHHVGEAYPWIKDKLYVTRNGIEPDYFPLDQMPLERPRRAIYSSSPDRGLDFLLELWPDVRAQVPDAELVYCYSAVYDKVAETNPVIAKFRDKVAGLAKQDGVVNLGSLTQPQLASAMAKCRAWLAPSYHSPGERRFHETYCIGAVESAAAGCHRIASDWGALSERIIECGEGELIRSDDETPNREWWVAAIVDALADDRPRIPDPRALALDWRGVAEDFAALDGRIACV